MSLQTLFTGLHKTREKQHWNLKILHTVCTALKQLSKPNTLPYLVVKCHKSWWFIRLNTTLIFVFWFKCNLFLFATKRKCVIDGFHDFPNTLYIKLLYASLIGFTENVQNAITDPRYLLNDTSETNIEIIITNSGYNQQITSHRRYFLLFIASTLRCEKFCKYWTDDRLRSAAYACPATKQRWSQIALWIL